MSRTNPRFLGLGLIWAAMMISVGSGCTTSEKITVPAASSDSGVLSTFDLVMEYQESFPKYILQDGRMTGMCMEILQSLEEASGLRIGAREDIFMPFKRLQLHLEQGKTDLFIGMKKTNERSQYALFLEPPIYTVRSMIAVRADSQPPVKKIEDIYGQTVLVPVGAATVQYMRRTYPDITIDEGGDIFTCMNKLMRGRHNFIVYHDLGLIGAIKKMGLQDQVIILPIILDEYTHYVAVRQSLSSEIIKHLEMALKELRTTKRLEAIRARYSESG